MNYFLKKLLDGIEHDECIAVRKRVDLMMGRDRNNNEYEIRYLNSELISNSEDTE